MSIVLKAAGLAALAAAGMLLAVALPAGGRAADTTTTEVTTATTTETTTEPATTEVTTTTVEQTTTQEVTVAPTTTAETTPAESSGDSGIPTWVWVLIGVLLVALILVMVLSRRGGRKDLSVEQQRRLLESALGSWALQGWAIQSQTADTAVLQRGGEQMLVSVDAYGSVTTRPLPPAAPER